MNEKEAAELRAYYDDTEVSDAVERGRWETDTTADPMVTTSLRLPKSVLDWVRAEAEAQQVKPTALIRRWIEDRRTTAAADPVVARLERLEQAVFHRAG